VQWNGSAEAGVGVNDGENIFVLFPRERGDWTNKIQMNFFQWLSVEFFSKRLDELVQRPEVDKVQRADSLGIRGLKCSDGKTKEEA
jgi:hypothetical protein